MDQNQNQNEGMPEPQPQEEDVVVQAQGLQGQNPDGDGNENENPEIPQIAMQELLEDNELRVITMTEQDVQALVKFIGREILNSLALSFLSIVAFWSILVHGNYLIYFILQGMLCISALASVKDIEPVVTARGPGRGALDQEPIIIRVTQIMLLHFWYFFVHFVTMIMSVTMSRTTYQYFNVKSPRNLRYTASLWEQIDGLFAETESTRDYGKISNQIFWTALKAYLSARMVVHLVKMGRTPTFRAVLRFEAEILISATLTILVGFFLFSHFAKFGDSLPVAAFLVLNLVVWIIFVLLKITYTSQLDIPRTNDILGALQMILASLCQTKVCGLLFSGWDLMVSILSSPDYTDPVRRRKFRVKEDGPLIRVNIHTVSFILFLIVMTRFFVQHGERKKLMATLDRLEAEARLVNPNFNF